ncbi:MAG: DMT family transporter, partial [Pseudomonadota bacterium]
MSNAIVAVIVTCDDRDRRPELPAPDHRNANDDNLPLAIGAILFTVFALSLGDALIKFASGDFPIWQIFVLRSLIVLPTLLGYLAWRRRSVGLSAQAIGWVALRSLMLVAMWLFFYIALPHLDLSVAAATYYTIPIFLTIFSALLLRERVSALGWAAVAIGFAGMLLILRPDADALNLYALSPLLAAILYALAMILTRSKCRDVDPVALSIALNIAFILIGGAATAGIAALGLARADGFLTAPWSPMGGAEWLAMALLAAAILIGSVGAAIAYQNGSPAMIGVFDFAYVGFAVIWGLLFFAETPDAYALLGIALI